MHSCILAGTILLLLWIRTRVSRPYVNRRICGTSIRVLFFPILFKDFLVHPWRLRPAPSRALIISSLRGSQSNPVYQFQSQPLARNTIRSLFSAQNLMGPEFTWLKSLTAAWQENDHIRRAPLASKRKRQPKQSWVIRCINDWLLINIICFHWPKSNPSAHSQS